MKAVLPILGCLLVTIQTASAQYYQRLEPDVWHLRITNPADAPGKLCARLCFVPNRDPWWVDLLYLGSGDARRETPPTEEWLSPGETSQWLDIGPYMSSSPAFAGSPNYMSSVFIGAATAPESSELRIVAEIARGPEKRLVRRIEVRDPHPTKTGFASWLGNPPYLPTLGLLIPVDPAKSEHIYTLEEAAQQQLDWIASFGPTPKPPRNILFISHQARVSFKNPTRLERMNTEILRRLGYNNLTQYATDAADIEAIRAMGVEPIPAKHIHRGAGAKEAQEYRDLGLWEYVRVANFGDEIDILLNATPEQQDAAFVAYLKEAGFDAMDFVRPADEAAARALPEQERWKHVHLGGPLPPEKPKLFYEAATFRYKLWTRELAESTREVQQNFPRGVVTGANYSPHLAVWPDVRKWINIFRDGGMTMPWSEDWWWQVPEVSPQTCGFILDALRHAANYHNAPSCYYTIPDSGTTASHLLRMNYFALGHQAKMIDHFAIYHQAFGTCDYIDFAESEGKFRSIHRVLTDVGKVDSRLYPARMRKAQVAIMLSAANDVWNTEDLLTQDPPQQNLYWASLNVDNHERKAIWLALRHAQIPVDLITDEDIAAGMLEGYKVLYIVGQEMNDRAVPALQQWVAGGGRLVGVGGGGMLNQYREPIAAMAELYGVAGAQLERHTRSIGPRSDLPGMTELDMVAFASEQVPALCSKQLLTPEPTTPVVARFRSGGAAAVERIVGRGRAMLLGWLPGLAYVQPATAEGSAMPEGYPENLRRLIVMPAEAAGVARHVVCSDPLVDATLQEGPRGAIVTLTSFRNKPLGAVTVVLAGLPQARAVTSLRHGALQVSRTSAGPAVTLPLDEGDFLVVD